MELYIKLWFYISTNAKTCQNLYRMKAILFFCVIVGGEHLVSSVQTVRRKTLTCTHTHTYTLAYTHTHAVTHALTQAGSLWVVNLLESVCELLWLLPCRREARPREGVHDCIDPARQWDVPDSMRHPPGSSPPGATQSVGCPLATRESLYLLELSALFQYGWFCANVCGL